MDDRTPEQQILEGGHSITLSSPNGRIKLLPPSPLYDEANAQLRTHSESRRYLTFWPSECKVEFVRNRREQRTKETSVLDFNIFLCDPGPTVQPKFIGITGLLNIDRVNDSCSAGILIHPDYFRGGYATLTLYTLLTFAFEDESLHMHRICFETAESNVQMRGWLENVVGAQLEFRWREAWTVLAEPGKRENVVGYSILRSEWKDAKARMENRLNRRRLTNVPPQIES